MEIRTHHPTPPIAPPPAPTNIPRVQCAYCLKPKTGRCPMDCKCTCHEEAWRAVFERTSESNNT